MHLDKGRHWIKLHYADRGTNNDAYIHMDIEKQ
jgi:hypothetical protein